MGARDRGETASLIKVSLNIEKVSALKKIDLEPEEYRRAWNSRSRLEALQTCLLKKTHRDSLVLIICFIDRDHPENRNWVSDSKMLKEFYIPKRNVKCQKVPGREKKQTVGSQCHLSGHPSDNWLPGTKNKGARSQAHSTRRNKWSRMCDYCHHSSRIPVQDVQRRTKEGVFLQGLPNIWTQSFFFLEN